MCVENRAKITLLAVDNFGIHGAKSCHCLRDLCNSPCVRAALEPPSCHIHSQTLGGVFTPAKPPQAPPTWGAGLPTGPENVNNMPDGSRGSFRGSAPGEEMEDRQQRHEGNPNIVSVMAQLADENLMVVRVGSRFFRPAADSVSSLC